MAASLPEFDPQIIERHVEGLLRKSSAFVVGSVVLGVALGAAFGATPLTSLGASWPIPRMFGFATLLVGGIVGGIVGYVIGDTRSFMYKLQAQIALAQVKAARDSEAVLNLLHGVAKATPKPTRQDQPSGAVRARVQPPTETPTLAPTAPAPAQTQPVAPAPAAPPAPVEPTAPQAPAVAPTPVPAPAPAPEPVRLTAVAGDTPAPPPLSPPLSS